MRSKGKGREKGKEGVKTNEESGRADISFDFGFPWNYNEN